MYGELRDKIAMTLLPEMYRRAIEERWMAADKEADHWKESVGLECYDMADALLSMRDVRECNSKKEAEKEEGK